MGGGTPVGPQAWQEWNVNELTDLNNYDVISGFPVYKALLCDVVKIESGPKKTPPPQTYEPSQDVSQEEHRSEKLIYLDNNATSQVADEVREVMLPYLGGGHGNPSSIHIVGRNARADVENARRQVAKLINVQPRRIIFTGGGSEADNLAIKGMAFAQRDRGKHIITTSIEHPAVMGATKFLAKEGFEITYLAVDEDGWLAPESLRNAITDDTILVTIMMANNEVGTVLPVKELCDITHERGIIFHTDAVQAVGKMKVDVHELDVDMLSISGHKFHAPKGIGALYIRKGIELEPLIHGGKQEGGLRAGTENVPSIVGLGKAAELAVFNLNGFDEVSILRDKLENKVRELVPKARLNGHSNSRLPNTLNLTLPGLRGESIVIALDQHGIAVSSGSACKSGSPEPTHVLIAMGRTEEEAHCSIRFSLSHYTTENDINRTIHALSEVMEEKELVRLIPCK
jgi:cysteine desulfurase NifS